MKFTVYVLFSEKYSKHHSGFTINLEESLLSHNENGNGWTAKYSPWKLIFSKEFETKKDAIKFEKWLKSRVGIDFINNLEH
ncbi:GIY-YIG nuclease family protein [Moheibacter sediminis]|uniref:Putative endonuclease n=1 Tax=Moheibacter sediminis TaxID=1434700 RepID=A0A1W2C3C1_9FLAO|nr:GIY-YIG nuclease family protein [Moheibacter sediminis]SMC79725.1 putative endonuclease [Moheibacter sediminis]